MFTKLQTLPSCTTVQKRSILKIAIELVKTDNRIHSKEVSILESLQDGLGVTQEELDFIHYISLSEAVSCIRQMEGRAIDEALGIFDAIIRADSDVDFEENLLYAAVTIACRPESSRWGDILSVPGLDLDAKDRQIVFLEKRRTRGAHEVLDDKYDNLLISKAFGDIGLRLFYLPNVLEECGLVFSDRKESSQRIGLLKKSMSYLMPVGDSVKVKDLDKMMASFDSSTFFKVVISRLGVTPEFFPYQAFLMVKVRGSVVLDDDNAMHHSCDFFCMDISTDVKHRILSFVSLFGDNSYMLPYDGYYKILFDHFSSEAKINSEVSLDDEFQFRLSSLGGRVIPFESSPQARTFYLLLLRYGRSGISQETFSAAISYLDGVDTGRYISGGAFDLLRFDADLLSGDEEWRKVIHNTISIYTAISTKDSQQEGFLSYISSILSHRSSLKTYLNKGFRSVQELADKDLYLVGFDKQTNSYYVGIGLSMFLLEQSGGSPISLEDSSFWKSLL